MSLVVPVTSLSNQSVVSGVLTLPSSIYSAHSKPWPRWYKKEYRVPETIHNFCKLKAKKKSYEFIRKQLIGACVTKIYWSGISEPQMKTVWDAYKQNNERRKHKRKR